MSELEDIKGIRTGSANSWPAPIPIESLAINTLSLRDYFAIHAPESCVPKATWGDIKAFLRLPENSQNWMPAHTRAWEAHYRYQYADAMMVARKPKS